MRLRVCVGRPQRKQHTSNAKIGDVCRMIKQILEVDKKRSTSSCIVTGVRAHTHVVVISRICWHPVSCYRLRPATQCLFARYWKRNGNNCSQIVQNCANSALITTHAKFGSCPRPRSARAERTPPDVLCKPPTDVGRNTTLQTRHRHAYQVHRPFTRWGSLSHTVSAMVPYHHHRPHLALHAQLAFSNPIRALAGLVDGRLPTVTCVGINGTMSPEEADFLLAHHALQ